MSCDECAEVFASGITGLDLQVEVDARFPNFFCEACSVSHYSPGKVEAGEKVVFLTIHPIHYDNKTGTLSPVAFEQLTRNDLSLLRQAHANEGQFNYVLSHLIRGGKVQRAVDHCCVLPVDNIRAATDHGGRVLGVYDTAIEPLPSHASVFVRKDYLQDKPSRLEARRLALSIFEPHLVPVEDVFPPVEPGSDMQA